MLYNLPMRIRHKGLRSFYRQGNTAGVPSHLAPRLRRILLALDTAERPGNMALPGYRLHPLKGDMAGWWSVRVTRNWRVLFRFEDGKAVDVDLIDYH